MDDLLKISSSSEFEKILDKYEGDLKGNVSGYVQKRASEEGTSLDTVKRGFLAEAYAEWKTSESPRECAQEVGELVQKLYNEAYG
ncbi:hypothetical protein [Slackia heliotrinireducens]|uniref:hypothetical protein n=1 Tax=Slackia heliotrinireducens TaxID=84110 RepID=UPI0001A35C17|nr:hypothetical protein [Slackia heliotrinireducens]